MTTTMTRPIGVFTVVDIMSRLGSDDAQAYAYAFACLYLLVAYYPFAFIYKYIVLPLYGRLHLPFSRAGLPVHNV